MTRQKIKPIHYFTKKQKTKIPRYFSFNFWFSILNCTLYVPQKLDNFVPFYEDKIGRFSFRQEKEIQYQNFFRYLSLKYYLYYVGIARISADLFYQIILISVEQIN